MHQLFSITLQTFQYFSWLLIVELKLINTVSKSNPNFWVIAMNRLHYSKSLLEFFNFSSLLMPQNLSINVFPKEIVAGNTRYNQIFLQLFHPNQLQVISNSQINETTLFFHKHEQRWISVCLQSPQEFQLGLGLRVSLDTMPEPLLSNHPKDLTRLHTLNLTIN